jgi:hypothetical protein
VKALVIKTTGEREVREFSNETSYTVLSGAVGGLIECVNLPALDVEMWVNEEGKLTGLDFNPYGTALWAICYGETDIIVGDIVLTGGTDEEGYTLGLPEHALEFFLSL